MNSDHLMKNYVTKRQVFRSGQKLNHYIDPSRKVCSKTLKIKKCGCLKAEFKAERAEMSVVVFCSSRASLSTHLIVLDGLVWTSYKAGLGWLDLN